MSFVPLRPSRRTPGSSLTSPTAPATIAATPSTPRSIERELGWQPQETFESGIRRTVAWYLDHQDWVAAITSGSYRDWIETQYAKRGGA